MIMFLFAVMVAALGVGAYAHYNPGVQDITIRSYHFSAVPDWEPLAVAAGVPLFLFLLHAIYASARVRMMRRASQRHALAPSSLTPSPRQGPKRSWNAGE
jgi:hypothetical protein